MENVLTLTLVVASMALASSGCLGTNLDSFMATSMSKASFDLNCPEDQLQAKDLQGSIGVSGCGRRARYVWVDGVGWTANTITDVD